MSWFQIWAFRVPVVAPHTHPTPSPRSLRSRKEFFTAPQGVRHQEMKVSGERVIQLFRNVLGMLAQQCQAIDESALKECLGGFASSDVKSEDV